MFGIRSDKNKAHLKTLLDEIASFAEALHDGLVPQNILLAQVLSPLPRLQNQAIDQVEICQEVPHPFLQPQPGLGRSVKMKRLWHLFGSRDKNSRFCLRGRASRSALGRR